MPSSWVSTWSHPFLNAMLRAVNCASSTSQLSAWTGGSSRYRNLPAADWDVASNGEASITGAPLAMTHANTGTITNGAFLTQAQYMTQTLSIGTAASVEVETSNLANGTVVSGPSSPAASTLTRFKIAIPKSKSTVSVNLAVRNKLVDLITNKSTAHFSAAGNISVYSGAAPDVDSAATGTLLWRKATTTTTWNAAGSDACVLAAGLTGNAEAFGANQVVGYCRFEWSVGGTDYVIQGSVGEATGDFQFTNLDGAGNNEMADSTSYTLSGATISFVV